MSAKRDVKLRLTQTQRDQIRAHLFPGDGLEAVALALCGRRADGARHCLSAQEIVNIPYDECKVRSPDAVIWSTDRMVPLLEKAAAKDLAIVKFHSHPG